MLTLQNRELRVELLDPAFDRARLGPRFCWGGYIWQVHDAKFGPLVSGPEFPKTDPTPFNGQGLPESFRHRTRNGTPLTWSGNTGIAIGAGILTLGENNAVTLTEPCRWIVTPSSNDVIFQTRQAAAGFSYELTRKVELLERTLTSFTQLTNVADAPLVLEWFAHPFWALTAGRARITLPAGTTITENPGFTVAADGTLGFKRAFVTKDDNQFSLLALPSGHELALTLDHPRLARVTFATSFIPNECPVWANAHTVSVEPYLSLQLTPGETRHWNVRHSFEASQDRS